MGKPSQLGIMVILLGAVVALTGFFPGVMGLEAARGIGVLQALAILAGFGGLIGGAYIYVKVTYYLNQKNTLAQRIAVRLSLTGLLISAATGLADVLGFGSHPQIATIQRPLVGTYQLVGMFVGFAIASFGVIIYTLMGDHDEPPSTPDS